nr:PREDICTED: moesin-like [Paralichthys olivaceus]
MDDRVQDEKEEEEVDGRKEENNETVDEETEDEEDEEEKETTREIHHTEKETEEKEELNSTETLSHDGETPEDERREGEKDSGRLNSEDICPTSPNKDKDSEEVLLSSSDALTQTAETDLHPEDAPLHLREAPPERHADRPTSGLKLEKQATAMDAASQSSVATASENERISANQNPAMEAKEGEGAKEEGGQNSAKMNGEAGDKKSDGRQSSKYKTVSYRRIRRGNTKQRIDEFEAMMNF